MTDKICEALSSLGRIDLPQMLIVTDDLIAAIQALVDAARREERERCAQCVLDNENMIPRGHHILADAIRSLKS